MSQKGLFGGSAGKSPKIPANVKQNYPQKKPFETFWDFGSGRSGRNITVCATIMCESVWFVLRPEQRLQKKPYSTDFGSASAAVLAECKSRTLTARNQLFFQHIHQKRECSHFDQPLASSRRKE